MYNRYIPQSDGSYRRSRVQEQRNEVHRPPAKTSTQQEHCPPEPPTPIACQPEPEKTPRQQQKGSSVDGFLRQLLPKDFDTGDLLVILLLLLMAGDKREEQNTALLTLALYLFM